MRNMMRSLVVAFGAAALLAGTAAAPARADDDGWRGRGQERREWREHEWREHERHEWCEHHPYECGYPPAGVYYAPPPVVVAPAPPPPVVYAPAPSLDIVVPIHIR